MVGALSAARMRFPTPNAFSNAMPKKGEPAESERERRSGPEFRMMARWRPRIESNMNELERRGMNGALS